MPVFELVIVLLLAGAALAAAALDGAGEASEAARYIRGNYQARLPDAPPDGDGVSSRELTRRAIAAERRRLLALRADGTIGDDAFHRVEEELDWAELDADFGTTGRLETERG